MVRNTSTHHELIDELKQIGRELKSEFNIVSGKTLCASDFYEGDLKHFLLSNNLIFSQLIYSIQAQARLDGIFCDYDETEKLEFLKRCSENNIVNIEMESLCFSGLLNYANCKCMNLENFSKKNIVFTFLLEFF